MLGYIHSIETMGLVDGPGIRMVVFFAGCEMRCVYCHNPDTWAFGGEPTEPEELMEKILRYKNYYKNSGGGVTFSGGEPLAQPEFLLEMLKRCKAAGINTCIDTSGFGKGNYTEILKYTDLVLFDVKHYGAVQYKEITGMPIDKSLDFLKAVQDANVPLWVRHVVIPGLTDDADHIMRLKEYISTFKNVRRVELLPYHSMGEEKYKELGIPYRLEGVLPMDTNKIQEYQNLFFEQKNT